MAKKMIDDRTPVEKRVEKVIFDMISMRRTSRQLARMLNDEGLLVAKKPAKR